MGIVTSTKHTLVHFQNLKPREGIDKAPKGLYLVYATNPNKNKDYVFLVDLIPKNMSEFTIVNRFIITIIVNCYLFVLF